jgi:hypothetical protein
MSKFNNYKIIFKKGEGVMEENDNNKEKLLNFKNGLSREKKVEDRIQQNNVAREKKRKEKLDKIRNVGEIDGNFFKVFKNDLNQCVNGILSSIFTNDQKEVIDGLSKLSFVCTSFEDHDPYKVFQLIPFEKLSKRITELLSNHKNETKIVERCSIIITMLNQHLDDPYQREIWVKYCFENGLLKIAFDYIINYKIWDIIDHFLYFVITFITLSKEYTIKIGENYRKLFERFLKDNYKNDDGVSYVYWYCLEILQHKPGLSWDLFIGENIWKFILTPRMLPTIVLKDFLDCIALTATRGAILPESCKEIGFNNLSIIFQNGNEFGIDLNILAIFSKLACHANQDQHVCEFFGKNWQYLLEMLRNQRHENLLHITHLCLVLSEQEDVSFNLRLFERGFFDVIVERLFLNTTKDITRSERIFWEIKIIGNIIGDFYKSYQYNKDVKLFERLFKDQKIVTSFAREMEKPYPERVKYMIEVLHTCLKWEKQHCSDIISGVIEENGIKDLVTTFAYEDTYPEVTGVALNFLTEFEDSSSHMDLDDDNKTQFSF